MRVPELNSGRLRPFVAVALVGAIAGSAQAGAVKPDAAGATTQRIAVTAATAVLPPGFADRLLTTVPNPIGLAFTPDGRLLVTTQAGRLRVMANDALLATPALDLSARICTERERGLPGVAVDPNFALNHFIYLYYTYKKAGVCDFNTAQSPVNRVSRFVLSDSNTVDPASEVILIDNIPSPEGAHNGGDLKFGKDGYLYVSVGDGGCDYLGNSGCYAQNDASRDQNVLLGKILRITRDGAIPPGNPFTGTDSGRCNLTAVTTAAKCQETYAWGLRNPFRIAFDPNAGGTRFYINDVGEVTREEVDLGQAGADYGWNVREGPCFQFSTCGPAPAGMTDPIYSYNHSTGCKAVTGGAFVPNGLWPSDYNGAYLYSDYVCGKIFRLVPSGAGGFTATEFASGLGAGSAISLAFGSDGAGQALYYSSYVNGGEIHRIDFTGTSNRPPVASATATPTAGPVPLTVNFDASASSDPDGDPLTYVWYFGDLSNQRITTSPTSSYTYTVQGTYFATLYVRDSAGAVSQNVQFRIVAGDNPPVPSITFPTDTTRFAVGQTITLQGSASDAEDGALPNSALTWEVKLFHIDHTHPFLLPTAGNNIPIVGPKPEDLQPTTTANSYLIITLTATDSAGATATVTRILRPNLVDVTFNSTPGGVTMPVNETMVTTPRTLTSWQGLGLDVAAPAQVTQGAATYQFQSWSDGVLQATRTITTPAAPTTYAAQYSAGATSTTLSVGASGDDGDVKASDATYPPSSLATNTTGSVLTAGRRFVYGGYENLVGLIRFDTSSLPDNATITSAKLRLYVTGKADTDNRNLVADWYPNSNWPIDAADYALTSSANALSNDLTTITPQASNDLTLANLASISTTGPTALRLMIDGGQPNGDNYLQIASFDHPTLTEPQLVVTYSTP